MSARPFPPTAWRRSALAVLLAALPAAAPRASDASAAAGHPAEPAPVVATATASSDPMARLKQRLEEKLGSLQAAEAEDTHELKVTTKTVPPRPAKAAKPRPDLEALVDAHRADKAGAPGRDVHWSYQGEGAPGHWGALKPEFSTCANGQRQSPIDIRDGIAVDLAPVQFDYRPGRFQVIDNGHTVQVDVAAGNSIQVNGRRYELAQFHFHRPSEERIDGRQFEMSVHLVHRDPEGRLAVVAVLLERGPAQPVVQQVWNDLPLEKNTVMPGHGELDPAALLPADRRYYTYMGSLTTPPCTEGVLWMVMQQPVPATVDQIGIFGRLYPMNARPVQQAAGRLIKQSN
jgi:carbonic anhydrase